MSVHALGNLFQGLCLRCWNKFSMTRMFLLWKWIIYPRGRVTSISLVLCCSFRDKSQNTMLRFWRGCYTELVSVSEWQVWTKPQSFLFNKKENAFTVKSKTKLTNKIPHQVWNDTSIWWIQNNVLYKLKIQSFNQNICCIKDESRLYAEILPLLVSLYALMSDSLWVSVQQ